MTDGTLAWDGKKGDFNWKPKPPLPTVLKGRFAAEPKWVDLAAYRDGADPRDAQLPRARRRLRRRHPRHAERGFALAGSPPADAARCSSPWAPPACCSCWRSARSPPASSPSYEADRAERNFAAAEDTVNGLIFNIAQGLRNVEGIRVESLDKILGQVRTTVERLTETDPGNPR